MRQSICLQAVGLSKHRLYAVKPDAERDYPLKLADKFDEADGLTKSPILLGGESSPFSILLDLSPLYNP